MATFEEVLDKAVTVAVKRAMLAAHPVGSLYLSLSSDNPGDLLGGYGRRWGLVSACGVQVAPT